jgi:hypothetical protein
MPVRASRKVKHGTPVDGLQNFEFNLADSDESKDFGAEGGIETQFPALREPHAVTSTIRERILSVSTPMHHRASKLGPSNLSKAGQRGQNVEFGVCSAPDSVTAECHPRRGPEPWALSCDPNDGVLDTSGSATSYRDYLRSRGSQALQRTLHKQTTPSHQKSSAFVNTEATCAVPVSAAVSQNSKWNVPADNHVWLSSATKSNEGQYNVQAIPVSDCSQQTQMQATSATPTHGCNQVPFMLESCQMQSVSVPQPPQQFVYCSSQSPMHLESTDSSRYTRQLFPIAHSFNQAPQSVMNLFDHWTPCDATQNTMQTQMYNGHHITRTEGEELMAIAMPDAFLLSHGEIAAQLQSAAQCTYED